MVDAKNYTVIFCILAWVEKHEKCTLPYQTFSLKAIASKTHAHILFFWIDNDRLCKNEEDIRAIDISDKFYYHTREMLK